MLINIWKNNWEGNQTRGVGGALDTETGGRGDAEISSSFRVLSIAPMAGMSGIQDDRLRFEF